MTSKIAIEALTEAEAASELARLAIALNAANAAYYTNNTPEIDDAEYDALKRRNAAIEARYILATSTSQHRLSTLPPPTHLLLFPAISSAAS